jgi:ankyrin repeat protein
MMIEESPTTPEGFRKLDHETIFIAGSQDVLGLRADVEWAIKSVIHQLAPSREFRAYSWDIELADSGFDQTKSMQKSIPRPSDPNCVGVLCLMAERIGHPFADESAHNLIHNIEAWTKPGHQYRLHHPWPTDRDTQKQLVKEGCYPLTGTVFEFIDAYSTLKIPSTPLWFSVIADRPIDFQNYETVGLGNYRLRTEKANSLTDADFDSWKENDYNLQTAAIKNFVCALMKKDLHPNTLQTREQVISEAKRFVAREVIKQHVGTVNPYKALNYFDVFDADNFRGRRQEIERAASDLFDRFDSHENNVIRIVGNSGSGKSSFLRAGLIAHFHRPEFRRDIRTVVFSKTDLDTADGTPVEVIRSIFDFVAKQTDLVIPPQRIDICKQGRRAAGLAVELLQELLPIGTNGRKSKLIFAIDQFEEILDCLADPNAQRHWYPLAQFIDIAGRCESIGIAYALERSCKEALSQPYLPDVFRETDEIEIDGYGSEFIRSIIDKPFKSASYPLCRGVVKEIAENARALRQVGDSEDAILPLIALKLSRLFDNIRKHRKPIATGGLKDASEVAFDEHAPQSSLCITRDEIQGPLDFNSLIAQEAERAWEGAGKTIFDEKDLDSFLQPLVTVGGPNFDDIQLQTMQPPPYSAEQKAAVSFKRHRLLVPNGKGLRLVHKAVIRDWKAASNWFNQKQDFLKKQELYRHKAWEWTNRGRSQDTGSITRENINDVAEILSGYFRSWGLVGESSKSLAPEDKLLFDYCLFVFRQSQTPLEPITYMGTETGRHVHQAARYGLVDLLEKFYEIDPGCIHVPTEENKNTPLHAAAWAHEGAVSFLLKKGAKLVKNKNGWRPIAAAIQMGDMNIFNRLVKASKGKGLETPDGGNLLHVCAQLSEARVAPIQVKIAWYLSDIWGLDPKQTNNINSLPLHVAADTGHFEAFKHFADQSDITQAGPDKYTALHFAARNGHTAIVKHLLYEPRFAEHIHDQTESGETALHLACKFLRADVVKLLVSEFDLNEPTTAKGPGTRSQRPLHLVLQNRAAEEEAIVATARALLESNDIDPNATDSKDKTPLAIAEKFGDEKFDEVKRLLIHHPRIDPDKEVDGVTALSVSAKRGDWDALRTLQKRSTNPHSGTVDQEENTMLHLLIDKDAPQDLIEETFSARTADVNALNDAGLTPLLRAIQLKRWSLVREILKIDVIDPTIHGEQQLPALMMALDMKADTETLNKLIEVNQSLLTQPDYFGWTPLHRAVAGQRLDLIEKLTKLARDRDTLWAQKDRLGRLPADLASPFVRESLTIPKSRREWPAPKSWDSSLNWTPAKGETLARIEKRIEELGSGRAPANDRDIQTTTLPFYDQETVRLVRVKSPSWNPAVTVYCLEYEDRLYQLDGTSPPIHDINSRSKISLNSTNVLDYLRFFCFFVRADEGPFIIAEGLSQTEIPASLTPEERSRLRKVLRPASYNGYVRSKQTFQAMASVYYSNAIFLCDFEIKKSGLVLMIDDLPVVEELSSKINQPISFKS